MSSKTKTTATKEEATPALVPKLRFPEFRSAVDWEERTLGSLGSFASGGTPSKDNPDYWNGSIPWVSASSMYDLVVERADHYVTPLAIGNGTRIARKGSILILVRGSMLFNRVPICIAGIDVAFNQDVKALDVDASIDTSFLLYQLSAFQSRFPINETGIGAGKIELDHLKGFELFVPTLAEQQKIAECLSSVDELLAAQARKVDALKTHKKGLMQQLFPREGETVPRLRFPEFQAAAEWEEKRLGDVCVRIMDGTHFSPKAKSGPRPYLTSKNIQDGKITLSNLSYISEEEHREIFKRCPVMLNDVLLTKDGANTGNCAINDLAFEFSLLSSVAVLRGKNNLLDQRFLYQAILSDRTQRLIRESMSGQAITRITLEKIGNFSIPLAGFEEQQRIADCLSSLDALITAETQKLAALKTHKRGLMQQLFPSPEEVEA